jgi:hypothetical protein
MAGIIERIGSLAGTEAAKAINLAHGHFNERMGVHGHTGRAIVETIAEVCRNHPNLVGIAVGLLVEQLLVEEKHRHDAHAAALAEAPAEAAPSSPDSLDGQPPAVTGPASTLPADHPDRHLSFPHVPVPSLQVSHLRPGKIAGEVFGALILLKIGAWGARLFRRKNRPEIWFAPAAHIHLFSGTLATYYFIKSLRSPKVSAWRHAAVALFATDAIKPLLKHRPALAKR